MLYVKYKLHPDGDVMQKFFPGDDYTPAKCLYEFKKEFADRSYTIVTIGASSPQVDNQWVNPAWPVFEFPRVKKRRTYFGRYVD